MQTPATTRRRFLASTAGAAAGTLFAPYIMRAQGGSPNSKLNLAIVGANGKGKSDWQAAMQEGNNIVAMCDVDPKRLEEVLAGCEKGDPKKEIAGAPRPKGYTDFRKMLEENEKTIDGVIISAPDHVHFPAAMMAVGMKKHICVQKPMCNFIWEVRELHKAAKKAGVVTQMGNQGRTMEGQRLAKEWVDQGVIGKLKEVRLWTNRPIWPQGMLKKIKAPVPADLDWDLWLAANPHIDYFEYEDAKGKKGSVHPFAWRGWWAYGSGAQGDMGCHIMDGTFTLLDQKIPTKIEVESAPIDMEQAPAWSTLIYHFAGTDKYPALKVTWQDGTFVNGQLNKPERHPAMDDMDEKEWRKAKSGMMFIGEKGVIFEADAYLQNPSIYPKKLMEDTKAAMDSGTIKKTEKRSTHPGEPQKEWAHAIKNKLQTSSNFDYAAPLTEFVLLGNLAIRSGQTVEWDKEAMKVTNVAEANQYVGRPAYRKGWEFKA